MTWRIPSRSSRRPPIRSAPSLTCSSATPKPCSVAKGDRREPMPQRATRPVLASLSGVLLVLGGCLGTPPTRFYLLPALTDVSSPAAMGERTLTIGVGPVTLPPYLDRLQIVTRASQAQLHLAEFDQWAASLQDTVARVLAEN